MVEVLILYMGDVEIVVKVPEGIPKEVVERAVKREMDRIERLRSVKGILSPERVEKVIEEIESGDIP